ncbi:alpha/beta hydrolase [Temperatibacter marinus]|uniref:Alpha/beta hydrolase n=1 Tax=Temperatibacter marinus TaxID=1456591 RepID=A0AA52H9Q7_9PROT|nr:alpha/beta hydrolase [Temperatibacter marinus]WND01940.1 alpha/beta hydrolase [Temperatibacter marinus]
MKSLKIALYSFALFLAAFLVFSEPDLTIESLKVKYANEQSQWLALSGGTVHIQTYGDPKEASLFLIHGSNSSLHTWHPWIEILSDQFHIVAIDMPGHGLTGGYSCNYAYDCMTTVVEEVRQKLAVAQLYIAGNSMGGGISAHYALTYPDRVKGLILLDAAGVLTDEGETDRPLAFKLAPIPVINLLFEYITPRSVVVEGTKKSISNHTLITKEMIDRYFDLNRVEGNRRATRMRFAGYAKKQPDIQAEMITVPTLILWGEEDKLIHVSSAYEWDRRLPNGRLIVYPKVGHLPMEEIPLQSATAAKSFIFEIERP